MADQGDDLSVEFLLPTTSNVNRLNQRLFGDSPSVAFFTTRLPSGLTMTPFDVLAAGSSPGRASVVAAPFIGGEISATELNYLEVKRYYVFKRFELYLDQVDSVSILGPFRELRMAVGEDGRFKVVNPRRAGFLLIPGVTRSVFLNGRSDDSDIQRLKLHGPRHGGIPGVFVIKVDGPQKKE